MSKNHLMKVKLNRSDKYRAVITDTAPFEVPIIISNDGFYKNLANYNSMSPQLKKLVSTLVVGPRKYTVPLRYNIVKDAESVRTLSLVHPYGQIQIADFYSKYDQLICEYTNRSSYSIRYPKKVGTTFYCKSLLTKKSSSLDTMDVENLARNPATYFTYEKFDRLYYFFRSDDHVRLEKNFKYFLSLDVSKCFDSIYTHSIAWAVKNKTLAKDYPSSSAFGNRFDKVMQQLNHNETSGICIGPETSRIFAEIILSKVDQIVFGRLVEKKIFTNSDYECRRYVDNYYIFANSEETRSIVKHEISLALREYKLQLNEEKTEKLTRPFYTQKSLVIDKVNQSIQQLWDKTLIDETHNGQRYQIPCHIRKHESLFGKFTREVKAACYSSNTGYDAIANYVVAAMKHKLIELIRNYKEVSTLKDSSFSSLNYRELMLLILDIEFYFFTLHPTVASSLRLSHTVVLVAKHLAEYDQEGLGIVREYVHQWTVLLMKAPTFSSLFHRDSIVPIELLNLLVSLQQLSDDGSLAAELLETERLENSLDGYFQIIVRLFIYKDYAAFQANREETFRFACKKLKSATHLTADAELTYLLLDLLSCPFIPVDERVGLLVDIWPQLKREDSSIGNITKADTRHLVSEIEQQHWFVWWQDIDLLSIIEKKELSAVYA